MKYVIIGLGNYGTALSQEFMEAGHEVVGVDKDPVKVDNMKENLAAAFAMDATDPMALQNLPFHTVDATFVCIGEDFGSSVRVAALLLQMKVPHIWARGNDQVHCSILESMGIEHILSPEAQAARIMSEELEFGHNLRSFMVAEDLFVFKMDVPRALFGYTVSKLRLQEDFGLKVLALVRGKKTINAIGVDVLEDAALNALELDAEVQEGDRMVLMGSYKAFRKFFEVI